MKQLAQNHTAVYQSVKTLYEEHQRQGTRPAFQQLLETFQSATGTFPKVFIIINAADECSIQTRSGLLNVLRSLTSTINLLVTSRDPALIDSDGIKCLNIQANGLDVRRYIEGRISQEPHLKLYTDRDAKLREEIVKAILENIQGMLVLHLRFRFGMSLTIFKVFAGATLHGHVGRQDQQSGSSRNPSKFAKRREQHL